MTNNFFSFALIPAAGRSERMGRPKLLLPFNGGTLIEHVLDAWRQSGVNHRVVVVAPDNQPLIDVCRGLPCHLVVPPAPPPDMKASICCGLEFIERQFSPSPADAWLVAPADLPGISAASIDAVLSSYNPANPTAVVPRHGSRQGHPVLFPWRQAAEVFKLPEAETLKDLLARSPLHEIPLPESARLEDLDTPQDYLRLQNRHVR